MNVGCSTSTARWRSSRAAAAGIGRQMAQGLAEAGAELVLCARKLERVEEAAGELPTRALALPST